MALAGTKPPEDCVPTAGPGNPSRDAPASKFSTFWQTVKPFGWQGLLLVAFCRALRPGAAHPRRPWYSDADYSHGFLVPFLSAYLDLAAAR